MTDDEEKEKRCPECLNLVHPFSVVRQGLVNDMNVIDVGNKCPDCGKEWGYDVFDDILLWKQSEARLKEKLKEEFD